MCEYTCVFALWIFYLKFDSIYMIVILFGEFLDNSTRPHSIVVERSTGMREVGGSIPGRIKLKTLIFEVLFLWLALST